MIYKVKARVIEETIGEFYRKLADGTVSKQQPDGEEIVASMKRAVLTAQPFVNQRRNVARRKRRARAHGRVRASFRLRRAGHFGVSEMRRRDRAVLRWVRSEVHGRWGSDYFGYPQAHEDDAERAVRAGLELVAAVGGLKTHAPLQTRVGIATGLVVVGDLIGSGASQEQAIVGETPNLAARLQGVAEPNRVVIAESTASSLAILFELEDLGAQDLKGIAGPVRAWKASRPSYVESRFDALHTSGLTELVGRDEELELLTRRWSKARTGEGQVVLLSGEPGIGKSRLTAAVLERLAAGPHTRLRYFCSPQHTDSALYPIKMSVGVLDHYNVSTRKLDETVHFYETVLGFTNGPRPPFNFPGAWLYSSGYPVLHLNGSHRPRSSSVPIRVSSIMSLSAAAALRQRSGISPKRESRTT